MNGMPATGGALPLLHYVARHRGEPGDFETLQKFHALAHAQDPTLAQRMPEYGIAATNLVNKLDTLDSVRRSAALDDLHRNVLAPIRSAVKSGKVKDALASMQMHGLRIAKAHGVAIPAAAGPSPTMAAGGQPAGSSQDAVPPSS